MGQQEYDNFKRLIKEWLDNHPDEYADFVEEMNDKKFKGFFKVFKIATKLAPKYKEAARKRIGDDRTPDFEELENILLHSDLAEKIVNEKNQITISIIYFSSYSFQLLLVKTNKYFLIKFLLFHFL